jgi:DNA polymerase III alpha subunit
MIPTKPLGVDLVTAIDMEPQLKDIVTNPSNPDNDDAAEIWEMALKLEGITRNTGKHAGGVVIAPGKLPIIQRYCVKQMEQVVLRNTIKMMLKLQVWLNLTSWFA